MALLALKNGHLARNWLIVPQVRLSGCVSVSWKLCNIYWGKHEQAPPYDLAIRDDFMVHLQSQHEEKWK